MNPNACIAGGGGAVTDTGHGVPAEDRQKVADWSNAVIAFDDETPAIAPMSSMYAYAERLAEAKKSAPRSTHQEA